MGKRSKAYSESTIECRIEKVRLGTNERLVDFERDSFAEYLRNAFFIRHVCSECRIETQWRSLGGIEMGEETRQVRSTLF